MSSRAPPHDSVKPTSFPSMFFLISLSLMNLGQKCFFTSADAKTPLFFNSPIPLRMQKTLTKIKAFPGPQISFEWPKRNQQSCPCCHTALDLLLAEPEILSWKAHDNESIKL